MRLGCLDCGGFYFIPGPIEPGEKRLQIAGFDRGAGPDAEAGGRIAISADVVSHAFGFEQAGDFFRAFFLVFGGERCIPRIGNFEANRGVGASLGLLG